MNKHTTIFAVIAAGLALAAAQAEAVSFAVSFHVGGRDAAVPVTVLANDTTAVDLAASAGTGRYFRVDVPPGQTYLSIAADGGYGDCDLYVSHGRLPTPQEYLYVANGRDNDEEISIYKPAPGTWYVLVYGAGGYSGASLAASWWDEPVVYHEQTYYVYPTYSHAHATTGLRVVWGQAIRRRPLRGVIPFILRRLTAPRVVRPLVVRPAVVRPQPRPQGRPVVHASQARVAAPPVVRRQAAQPAPRRTEPSRPAVRVARKPATPARAAMPPVVQQQPKRAATRRVEPSRPAARIAPQPATSRRVGQPTRPAPQPTQRIQPTRRQTAPATPAKTTVGRPATRDKRNERSTSPDRSRTRRN